MKICYSYHCSPVKIAVVDLFYSLDDRAWLVTRVNVPSQYRRQGIATRLLGEVVEDADAEEARLALHVEPYGDMTEDALVQWYETFGFVMDRDGQAMIREPQ